MSTEEKSPRKRKPKARHYSVILAAIDERIRCIPRSDENSFHLVRVEELIEELGRSLNGYEAEDEK